MHRVACIITRLNVGGPVTQAAIVADRLPQRGFETFLIHGRLSAGEGDMSYMFTPAVERTLVSAMGREVAPWRDLRACWQIYRLLCAYRPDVVHTHTAKAGTVGRLAAVAYNLTSGRRHPAGVAHTYHGHVFEGYFGSLSTRIFIAIERWLARRTDIVVAIAPTVRKDLVDTFAIASREQVRVVPLGLDLAPFAAVDDEARAVARVEMGLTPGRLAITTAGRLTDIKRHDLFIEMAARIAQGRPDVDFLIAGDGELRQSLESLAAARGIADRVKFLGWRTDLTRIYGASDVFVLTSRNEGTPVALIEAMATAVPGVSTDVGGVRDVITGPESGLLVPFGSAEALATAADSLLADADTRRRMGLRARAEVLARFDLDHLLDNTASLYADLMSAGRARRGR